MYEALGAVFHPEIVKVLLSFSNSLTRPERLTTNAATCNVTLYFSRQCHNLDSTLDDREAEDNKGAFWPFGDDLSVQQEKRRPEKEK